MSRVHWTPIICAENLINTNYFVENFTSASVGFHFRVASSLSVDKGKEANHKISMQTRAFSVNLFAKLS